MAEIVVGVDGSPSSVATLRWAALEAQRRGVELKVVLAYDWEVPGVSQQASPDLMQPVADFATATVDAAVTEARTTAPHIHAYGAAVPGNPASALLQAAADAGMLVVGSRGGGGFAGLLAGSVSVRVATHAPCPVVVVRGRTDNNTGPVIIGVDGSDSADVATGIAFEEAARRGCALTAVRAFSIPLPPQMMGGPIVAYDPANIRDDLRAELVERLAGWRDKYPNVPVEYVVEGGSPAGVLASLSGQAQLVVVGTRGHGAAAGLLLGSVGLQLLHHADCPVLIARACPGA